MGFLWLVRFAALDLSGRSTRSRRPDALLRDSGWTKFRRSELGPIPGVPMIPLLGDMSMPFFKLRFLWLGRIEGCFNHLQSLLRVLFGASASVCQLWICGPALSVVPNCLAPVSA